MIQIVDPMSDHSWDDKVLSFPAASIFHSQGWARVLNDSYGYKPLYLVSGDHKNPSAILPLFEVNSWLTGRRGVSVPFSDSCTPLAHRDEDIIPLVERAHELGFERNWKYVEIRGSITQSHEKPSTKFYGHRLDLNQDSATLFKQFDSSNRRAIRKAERHGVTFSIHTDLAGLEAFYPIFCQTRKRHGAPPQPKTFFMSIGRHLFKTDHGFVALAFHQRRVVAGVIFLMLGNQAIYKYGASDVSRQELRANNFVMWKGIERAKDQGCRTVEFGRSSIDNEGLRRFKRSWGTEEYPIAYQRFDPSTGCTILAPDRSSGFQAKVFHTLPIPVLRLIGRALYRHIA